MTSRRLFSLVPVAALLLSCGGGDLVLPSDAEPAAIEVVQGGEQSGRVGVALGQPVVARVTDSQGRPVSSVRVALVFTGDASGAASDPDTAGTDGDGEASFQVVLGSRVGATTAEVRVPTAGGQRTLAAPLQFQAVSADANRLVAVAGDSQAAPAGATLADPLVVQVTDAFGNPISGVPIAWAADAGSVSAPSSTTGSDGLASVERTLGAAAGLQHATASSPGLAGSPVTFTQIVSSGSATVLEMVSGDGQSALVGSSVADPLVVRAKDASGNPVAGIAVSWVVGSGDGHLGPETSLTDGQGLASTRWTLGPAPDTNTATAVISGVGTVGFTATANPGTPPSLALVVQPPAAAVRGVSLTPHPVVELREPDGSVRRERGVAVSVALSAAGATLRGTLTRATGADGRAEFGDLALEGPPASYTLAFTAAGYTGVSSGLIALARAATTVTILSHTPDPSLTGTPVRVRFRVESPGGTPDGSVRVTADDGTGCSASVAAGECTLSPVTVGVRTLTATFPGTTEFEGSSAATAHTVNAPPAVPDPAQSTVTAASATLAVGARTDVVVTVRDASGTALGGVSVTLTATGSGNTIDPAAATTDPAGTARFTFGASEPGARTLTAVAGGVTLAQQPTVTVAQAATTTRITSADPDPSPPGAPVSVHFTVTSDGGTPAGDVSVTLSGGGSCTATVAVGFCDLTPAVEGAQTLTATYAGSASFAGSSATAPHGVAAPSLTVRQQPSGTAAPGLAFRQQPEIGLLTGDGQPLARSDVVVTASLASGTGSVAGTATATTDGAGHARFTSLAIAGAPGDYTLRFDAPGFAPAISGSVTLALAATGTTIVSDEPDPSTVGAAVPVRYSVTSDGGTPTGSVTVSSDGGESCVGTVADGGCSLVFTAPGARTLTASYPGDGSFAASSGTAPHGVSAPNLPPVAVPDAFSGFEDQPIGAAAPGVLGNDSDPDGDPIRATLVMPPAHGTLTLAPDGSFTYTPAADFSGDDGFTYQANDATHASATTAVSLTVTLVNDAPSFIAGPDQSVDANSGPVSVPGWATAISPGPSDEAGQTLTFAVQVVSGAELFGAAPAVSPDGTLTYTTAGAEGTAQLSVTLQDNGGTANGGVDTSAPQTFTITLTGQGGPGERRTGL